MHDVQVELVEGWEVKPEILEKLKTRKEQLKTTMLTLESYTESSIEATTSNLNEKETATSTQDTVHSDSSEEVQPVSHSKKKQKKRMPRIADGKARYLLKEHELHGNFDF